MPHVTAVDKEELMCAAASGVLQQTDVAADFHKRSFGRNWYYLRLYCFAEQRADALFETRFEHLVHRHVIVYQCEIDIAVDEREAFEFVDYMTQLD